MNVPKICLYMFHRATLNNLPKHVLELRNQILTGARFGDTWRESGEPQQDGDP